MARSFQQPILNAPVIAEVCEHYQCENLPDRRFFDNALEDSFSIPNEKWSEFKDIFISSLRTASLIEEHDGRMRVLDSESSATADQDSEEYIDKLSSGIKVETGDSCVVIMPFAAPNGDYYSTVYKPAIEKAKLTPVSADNDTFLALAR